MQLRFKFGRPQTRNVTARKNRFARVLKAFNKRNAGAGRQTSMLSKSRIF